MNCWTAAPQWLAWLAAHGYRRQTLRAYGQGLRMFALWWGSRSVRGITAQEIDLFMAELYRRNYGLTTRRGVLTALRQFGWWAVRQGLWTRNHAQEVKYPRGQRPLPPIPSHEHVQAVLRALEEHSRRPMAPEPRAAWLRTRAMIELAYGAALRPAEVVGVHVHDVLMDRHRVRIRDGKGGKERIVPCGPVAVAAIRDYLTHGRPIHARGRRLPALFLTTFGRPASYHTYRRAVHEAADLAGLRGLVTPHDLRRRAGTDCYMRKPNPIVLAEYLGHQGLAAVTIYARVEPGHLDDWFREAHPRARPAT